MKTLHLMLKKKWFDMIASGEKKEEYREMIPHWEKRLKHESTIWKGFISFNHYDTVTFTHGYAKNAPRFEIDCLGIYVRTGKPEWGAEPGKEYFVIKLGKILTKEDKDILAYYNETILF